jgi:hypothetical protein
MAYHRLTNGRRRVWRVFGTTILLVLLLLSVSDAACSVSVSRHQPGGLFDVHETPLPSPRSEKPPASIQRLVAYRYGEEGIVVYFLLADRDGRQTSASGEATLTVKGAHTDTVFYRTSRWVNANDFVETQVGAGIFSRRRLVYSFDLIPYRDFLYHPNGIAIKVTLVFAPPDGSALYSETYVSR